MGELLSCPFCRELFSQDEGPNCPDCDLPLVPLHQLPLSLDGQAEAAEQGELDPPEDQNFPLLYLGRGRGILIFCCVLGLLCFFQPWVELMRPDVISLSGQDLASANAPWLWGGAVAWFILFPLVVSRRTVNQLRGIRVIATLFATMTLGEGAMLLLLPPASHEFFSSGLTYAWGLYASMLVAAIAALTAIRLGGSLEDLRNLPVSVPPSGPRAGDALH